MLVRSRVEASRRIIWNPGLYDLMSARRRTNLMSRGGDLWRWKHIKIESTGNKNIECISSKTYGVYVTNHRVYMQRNRVYV